MSALVWDDSTYGGGEYGHLPVGDKRIRIAAISWTTKRNDPEPWKLSTSLPGFYQKTWEFAEKDDAKQKAETLLAAFAGWIAAAQEQARG